MGCLGPLRSDHKLKQSENKMGKTKPGIVLGTMEFGRGPCVNSVPQEMVDLCLSKNVEVDSTNAGVVFNGIDTAYMYTGGQSEQILGDIGAWKGKTAMATKTLSTMDKLHREGKFS